MLHYKNNISTVTFEAETSELNSHRVNEVLLLLIRVESSVVHPCPRFSSLNPTAKVDFPSQPTLAFSRLEILMRRGTAIKNATLGKLAYISERHAPLPPS